MTRVGMKARISAKLGADVAGRALLFALVVIAARILGVSGFGAYAFALAVGMISAQIADGGLQVTLFRRLADEHVPANAARSLAGAVRARTYSALVLGAVAAFVAAAAGTSQIEIGSLAFIAVAQVVASQADLYLQVPRAAERLEIEAAIGLSARSVTAVVGALGLVIGAGLPALAVAHMAGALVGLWAARRAVSRFLKPSQAPGRSELRGLYVEALPIAVATIASLLMFRIDAVLLEALRGPADVGLYAGAYRPFEVSLLVPVAIMAGTFPRLVTLATHAGQMLRFGVRVGAVLLATSLIAAVCGWVAGPYVLEFAYGPDYSVSGELLRVLVFALPFIYVNAMLTQSLIALAARWSVAAAMAAGLIANVVANLALIPSAGTFGAAFATVAAEAVLAVTSAALLVRVFAARRSSAVAQRE